LAARDAEKYFDQASTDQRSFSLNSELFENRILEQ
jgi:hypothetical protein